MSHGRQSVWMCAVIQSDFPNQMDVFRWLLQDNQYRVIYILHDRDIVEEEHTRKMPDDTERLMKVGDLKIPHYHLIVKIPSKLTAETFSKRFGSYVNFQICGDSKEYARYLTHETFSARDKFKYNRDLVKGDFSLYQDLVRGSIDDDTCNVIARISYAFAMFNGDKSLAIQYLCGVHDVTAVKSIMSHAYFYEKFVCKGGET